MTATIHFFLSISTVSHSSHFDTTYKVRMPGSKRERITSIKAKEANGTDRK